MGRVGNNEIDNDIRQWVSGIASAFESHLDLDDLADADFGGDLLPDDDLASAGEKHRFELYGSTSMLAWPESPAESGSGF